jgi:hypothetical protein
LSGVEELIIHAKTCMNNCRLLRPLGERSRFVGIILTRFSTDEKSYVFILLISENNAMIFFDKKKESD